MCSVHPRSHIILKSFHRYSDQLSDWERAAGRCTHLLLLLHCWWKLLTAHLQPCWLTLQWENGKSFRLCTLLKTWTDMQQQMHRQPLSRNADNTADKFNSWTYTTDCSLLLVDQTIAKWKVVTNYGEQDANRSIHMHQTLKECKNLGVMEC